MVYKKFKNLIVLFLFLLELSFARNITIGSMTFTEQDIISTIIGISVIVIIVVVLLYLGGVWKPSRITFPWQLIVYLVLVIVIFVLPLLQRFGYIHIFPEKISSDDLKKWGFPQNNPLPPTVCKVLTYLALQEEILCYIPEIIFLFLLPFAAIFAITWGFLSQLKIFEGVANEANLYRLLAFIIAFMTIPMGTFMLLVAFWFSFMGAFSVAVFVAMFVAGVFFRGYGFVGKEARRAIAKTLERHTESIHLARDFFEELRKKVEQAKDDAEARNIIMPLATQISAYATILGQAATGLLGARTKSEIIDQIDTILGKKQPSQAK